MRFFNARLISIHTIIMLAALNANTLTAQSSAPTPSETKTEAQANFDQGKAAINETALSDSQIAALVNASNMGEIALSQLAAKKKGVQPELQAFAKEMIKIHTDNNKELAALIKKEKIKISASDSSKYLKNEAKIETVNLKSLSGPDFDRNFISAQIKLHTLVLQDLDSKLLPGAKSPGLKAFLEKTRPVVAQHLEHAQSLQTAVKQN